MLATSPLPSTALACVLFLGAPPAAGSQVAPDPPAGTAIDALSSTTISVPGLNAPVEIIRNRWGINHIHADTDCDLFFAQGYAAARTTLVPGG